VRGGRCISLGPSALRMLAGRIRPGYRPARVASHRPNGPGCRPRSRLSASRDVQYGPRTPGEGQLAANASKMVRRHLRGVSGFCCRARRIEERPVAPASPGSIAVSLARGLVSPAGS
jgi:hypothetical protein